MTLGMFFTSLGYSAGAVVLFFAARGRRIATEGVAYVVIAGFAGGILGAKLSEWIFGNWSYFSTHPLNIFDPRYGGRSIVGGILGGWGAVELAKMKLGIRRSTGDLFALALPAGEAIGRIGCFFNGCCYGIECHLPWAVYQHGSFRHPAQIYASFIAAGIFSILVSIRKKIRHEGDLFKLYLILYSIGRFFLEYFRERAVIFAGLSLVQCICLEVAVFSGLLMLSKNIQARKLAEGT